MADRRDRSLVKSTSKIGIVLCRRKKGLHSDSAGRPSKCRVRRLEGCNFLYELVPYISRFIFAQDHL
jgi:hypothetical protein